MRPEPGLPPEQQELIRRAIRLEWITIVHVLVTAVALYLTLGGSQAMKTAFLDDLIGIVAPVAYIIAQRYAHRPPSRRFPYGYHRALSVAYFFSALSIVGLGLFIIVDSSMKLIAAEHATIGTVRLFGATMWLGWFALAALLFNAIPRLILGRVKIPISEKLNDKILHSEAAMNRADWLAATAAAVGVAGVGFGLWWLDPVAALFIGVEITEEGGKHMKGVAMHLMSEVPTTVDYKEPVDVPQQLEERIRELEWVHDARARLREEGRVYFGEVFVQPKDSEVRLDEVEDALRSLYEIDWRLEDITIVAVSDIASDPHLKGIQRGRGGGDSGA